MFLFKGMSLLKAIPGKFGKRVFNRRAFPLQPLRTHVCKSALVALRSLTGTYVSAMKQ